MDELVFAIPTDTLWELLTYTESGLIEGNNEVLQELLQHGLFRKRIELEEDPTYKQLIPYGIISYKDSLYLFKRTSKQNEKRLHNKLTLGVGGHMNPGNPSEPKEQYLINELKREIFEEVNLLNGCLIEDISFIGFINDDSIEVGKVHIGLLFDIRLSNKELRINETDKMTAEWVDKSNISEFYQGMETWSRIAVDEYVNK